MFDPNYGSRNSRRRETGQQQILIVILFFLGILGLYSLWTKVLNPPTEERQKFSTHDSKTVLVPYADSLPIIAVSLATYAEEGFREILNHSDELAEYFEIGFKSIVVNDTTLEIESPKRIESSERQNETVRRVYQALDAWQAEKHVMISQLKKYGKYSTNAQDFIAYIEQYDTLAVLEYIYHGIPASVTLAQGLIESNAGKGNLTRSTNNHFGYKCKAKFNGACNPSSFRKSIYSCGCERHQDDIYCDHFEMYRDSRGVPAAVFSFQAHSALLRTSRYNWMQKYTPGHEYVINSSYTEKTRVNHCEAWAVGLKESGYATDKTYSEKLIGIMFSYNLKVLDDAVMGIK